MGIRDGARVVSTRSGCGSILTDKWLWLGRFHAPERAAVWDKPRSAHPPRRTATRFPPWPAWARTPANQCRENRPSLPCDWRQWAAVQNRPAMFQRGQLGAIISARRRLRREPTISFLLARSLRGGFLRSSRAFIYAGRVLRTSATGLGAGEVSPLLFLVISKRAESTERVPTFLLFEEFPIKLRFVNFRGC